MAKGAEEVLAKASLEVDLGLAASVVTDQATAAADNVTVTTRAIRLIGQGRNLLVWLRIDLPGNLIRAPHHGSLIISGQTSIVKDNVGIATRAITHVVSVLGVEGTVHGRLERRVRVASRVAHRVVATISVALRRHNHLLFT